MKKSRYSGSQTMDELKRVDAGLGVPDVCRELGISTATFYKWRAKYEWDGFSQDDTSYRVIRKICLR